MQLKKYKIKASAMLIALILGIIIASMTVGITILMAQQTKLTNQSSDGRIAYQAALSGIEDGLLRYKYARSKNMLSTLRNSVYGYTSNQVQLAEAGTGIMGSQYKLSFSTGYIGEGASVTYDAKVDESIDIDLSSYYRMFRNCVAGDVNCKKPTKITIKLINNKFYSDQEKLNGYVMTNFYSPVNVTIDDSSKKGEEQVVFEKTNDDPTQKEIVIDLQDAKTAKKCTIGNAASTQCHLKIKPMLARTDAGSIQNASGNRISGGRSTQGNTCSATSPLSCTNKFVKLDVGSDGYIEGMEPSNPSDFTIVSVGRAGELTNPKAYRKLEARIDGQTGNYLGIFDYGIYCGVTCLLGDEPLGS